MHKNNKVDTYSSVRDGIHIHFDNSQHHIIINIMSQSPSPPSSYESMDPMHEDPARQDELLKERRYHGQNRRHEARLQSLRIESNTVLSQYHQHPVPPVSKTRAWDLRINLQRENETMDEMLQAQIVVSGKFLQSLRRSYLLRQQIQSISNDTTVDKMVEAINDHYVEELSRLGCNRAVRVFKRQRVLKTKRSTSSKYDAKDKIVASATSKAVATIAKATGAVPKPKKERKPRAKKEDKTSAAKDQKVVPEPEPRKPEHGKFTYDFNPDIDYEAFGM